MWGRNLYIGQRSEQTLTWTGRSLPNTAHRFRGKNYKHKTKNENKTEMKLKSWRADFDVDREILADIPLTGLEKMK